MKREFLEGLGIQDKTVLDSIMTENGNDIQNVRTQLDTAISERDTARADLEGVKTQLKAFEGVDIADLQGKVATLTSDLQAKEATYQADLIKRDREASTTAFVAGLQTKFINPETAEHYAAKINTALSDPKNEGKSRADILAELTKGEDGKPRPGIFEPPANPNQVLSLPPTGDVSGASIPGSMPTLHETQAQLNANRIIK